MIISSGIITDCIPDEGKIKQIIERIFQYMEFRVVSDLIHI